MRFNYELNSEPVTKALESFEASLADNSPALKLIADDFREMITEQFATEGRAGGTPWAALAPSSARGRRAGSTILNSTGALLASFTDSGAAGHFEEADGESITLGSRLSYAMFHQTGAGRGAGQSSLAPSRGQGRGLPARPIIVLSDERTGRWVEILAQSLHDKAVLLGGKELGGRAFPRYGAP